MAYPTPSLALPFDPFAASSGPLAAPPFDPFADAPAFSAAHPTKRLSAKARGKRRAVDEPSEVCDLWAYAE